ncbi:MAG: hypothetical protein KA715_11415 [Xanthomonadaceae bacterium]|nr:hypothetical protein [Xanthomonadaceae bacterium]
MLNTKSILLIALSLIQLSTAQAEPTTEASIALPEAPRERNFYLGGLVGAPYSTNTAATTGGQPTGFTYGVNAGAQIMKNLTAGAFYNESLVLGNSALMRAGKRYGIEADYSLSAFETWSVALGYRLGLVQVVGVTPFFSEGYDIQSIGHGPKVSMMRKLSESFAFGLELSYFMYSNPQAESVSLFGNKAGSSIANAGIVDANLSFRFLL